MRQFKYQGRSILIIGLIFLLLFPVFFGGIIWLLGFFNTPVFYCLLGIYCLDILLIGWLFLTYWDKRLVINEQNLSLASKFFCHKCSPRDIKDIMLYATRQGKEFLRIRTKKTTYYLDEHYQPWNILLIEIENFVKCNNISSNLID